MRALARAALIVVLLSALIAIDTTTVPSVHAQGGFSDVRIDFGGVNGDAQAVDAIADQLWVGGVFSQAFDPDHVTSYPRANLAVFDFNTGDVRPLVVDTNDKVKAIETDDDGTVWVAGNFTEIAGQPVTYIAAFDAVTGQIDTSFNVSVDYPINALHYTNGWLYVGGEFGQINGLYYNKLARVDAATGAVDTAFRANPNATVRSIDSFGDRVYAAGLFDEVGKSPNNVPRRWIAGFDFATGAPAGPEFPFEGLQPGDGAHKAGLWRVHVSDDGNYVYTGDHRNQIIQWDRLTGAELWEVEAAGDIQAIAAEGPTVYLGTHEGFLTGNDQRLLFALNAADGSTDNAFVPLLNSFLGILEIEMSQGALMAVGAFTTVNGESSPHLVVFHGPAWTGATPLVGEPGDVNCDGGDANIGDALVIAQHSVGLRSPATSCPLSDPSSQIGPGGDVDGSGSIDIGDALLVAQCSVGLSNLFCPGS